jgi:glycosyltransferase involved in cell wall biosynthesis
LRILFLTETLPFPLDSGGRVKTFNTLSLLSRAHDVHCHALVQEAVAAKAEERLHEASASLTLHHVRPGTSRELRAFARSVIRREPFSIVRHAHPDVFRRIGRAAGGRCFDLVYCDHLSMVQYGASTDLPMLYDAHNVESELVRRYVPYALRGARRWLANREWPLLRAFERAAVERARLTMAASDVDARSLRELAPGAHVEAVPFPIDVSVMPRIERLTSAPRILHLGGLHWPPNADAAVHFAANILPIVRRQMPDASLTVVGRVAAAQSRRLEGFAGVRVMGRLERLDDVWRESRMLVVPLRSGSGVRVKILEAFARGVPVVSTSVGCEGLDAQPGIQLVVADGDADFARATIDLLTDDRRCVALAEAAWTHVVSRHAVEQVGPRLLGAVERAAGANPASRT